MKLAFILGHMALCVAAIVLVLLQKEEAGLAGIIGTGGAHIAYYKEKQKHREKLKLATTIVSIIFIISCVILTWMF